MATSTEVSNGFRVPKTAELVARTLRNRIIRGELKEGESLPSELALTEQFRISRPTLREAFRILEAERLIEVRRGARGGARVRTPDAQVAANYAGLLLQVQGVRLQDVYAARTVIESPAVSVVAEQRSAESVARLRANLAAYEELFAAEGADADGLTELSADFHALLVELAGNQTLTLLSGMLRHIVDGANRTYVEAQGSVAARTRSYRATMKSHARIVDLIEAGDVTGADELWRRHLGEVDRLMGEGGPAAGTVLDLLG